MEPVSENASKVLFFENYLEKGRRRKCFEIIARGSLNKTNTVIVLNDKVSICKKVRPYHMKFLSKTK